MDYITTAQAAEKWNITANRITIIAKEGRIPGAVRVGYRWMIPIDASKPTDGRTKVAKKSVPEELSFRHQSFEGQDVSNIYPPLSAEELQLKAVLEAFCACRFEESERLLGDLPNRIENRHIRISALRAGCFISICMNNNLFLNWYGKLTEELQKDFPRKIEMKELKREVDATLGENNYFSNEFRVEPGYAYHESYLPHLVALSCISLFFSNKKGLSANMLVPYEVNCAVFDKTASYADSQTIHLYLGGTYALLGMEKESRIHLRRALEIAEQHELYYGVATEYYYLQDAFESVLNEFPEKFRKRLLMCSEDIHKRYLRFMDTMSLNSMFQLLLHKEYSLILYAVQGYTNNDIAGILHISERTVRQKYSEIYDMLGVRNKQELVELYHQSIKVIRK